MKQITLYIIVYGFLVPGGSLQGESTKLAPCPKRVSSGCQPDSLLLGGRQIAPVERNQVRTNALIHKLLFRC